MSVAIINEESIASGQMDEVVFSTGMEVHLFNDEKWFSSLDRRPYTCDTGFGGKATFPGKGTVRLPLKTDQGEVIYWTLEDCLYKPDYINVLSEGRLQEDLGFFSWEWEGKRGTSSIYRFKTDAEGPTKTLKLGRGYGGVPILPVVLSLLGDDVPA